jgi:MSHA biogenesis protein MshK
MSIKLLLIVGLLIGTFVHVDTRADTLIDPTRPVHAPTKALSTVRGSEPVSRLTAIFQSNDRRVAVLDGRVVKVGDRIGDIVIQEILLDSVRYARAGRVEIVRLPKQAAAVRSARKDTPRRDAARNDAARNDAGSANSIRQETTP